MPESSNYVFGANILDNLTTGMYTDSRVIYREYIQNACDSIDAAVKDGLLKPNKGAVEIYTDDSSRTITIRDNGTGISARTFRKTLGNIANSDKTLGESKGFRGIGRLCGLAYCETLVFSSKISGENTISLMKCDAKQMRQLINENQSQRDVKLSASEVLDRIISFDAKESKDSSGHWFEVELINVNAENHELLDRESVIDYLSFVAPVPFNKNFSYRAAIYDYVQKHQYPLDEYVIKVNGEQIFKDYRTYVKTSKGEDHIFQVQFHEIYDDNNEVIAWLWYGLRNFQAVIDKDSPQRGLRLRKENIQIGDEDALQRLFKEDRGAHYFIGEVHAISHDLIPNSQRDYFNENQMRNIFERETTQYFVDTLHKLYHAGNDFSAAVDKIDVYVKRRKEYERKKQNGDYIDDHQRKEAEAKLDNAKKSAEEAKKKIANVANRYKGDPDSPIFKVVSRIAKERNATSYIMSNEKDGGDSTLERENDPYVDSQEKSQKDDKPKKKQWWTDRLTSVPKNDRKLITRVLRIVRKYVDETTMKKILDKIEEDFK